ncbi:MAG: hypothetical protein OXJ52_00990 [Oligoflexia bacterium]|nr:hypothetical protein [Oligoflexia bacterium]
MESEGKELEAGELSQSDKNHQEEKKAIFLFGSRLCGKDEIKEVIKL